MTRPGTTQVWADTVRQKVCESSRCRQLLWFAQHVRTGRDMPFDRRPEPLAVQPELETGREKWLVSLEHAHWSRCPGAAGFRRRGAAHG